MNTKPLCIYSGPGDYSPTLDGGNVVWRKDTTGNPLVAVTVTNIANVRKFAILIRIEAFENTEDSR